MKKRDLFLLASLSFLVFRSKRKQNHSPKKLLNPKKLWADYDKYREITINNRFFKHADILPLIQGHAQTGIFKHEILGCSVEGRSIHHLTWGTGKTKILLWSQMHGDEPTATMALLDIFNFLSASDEFDAFRNYLSQELELHFIPMLNPDGAQIWTRRNAMELDINRDARDLQTPEGNILKSAWTTIKPDFGFNLHDQSTQWAAGHTPNPATISFLAPAYNYQKDINPVREKAMQLISLLDRNMQEIIPGQLGRFNDDHDPRCFGDNLQKWGTSLVLFEAGGYAHDPEKQFIRKLNFYGFLLAFQAIATKSYLKENIQDYLNIPENSRSLYDLVLRNVTLQKAGREFKTNIGIVRSQQISPDLSKAIYRGTIEEISDMVYHYGYEELNASGLKASKGKVKKISSQEWENLTQEEEFNLLKKGVLFLKWSDKSAPSGPVSNCLLNITNKSEEDLEDLNLEKPANFLLMGGDEIAYAVVNGYLINLIKMPKALPNTWCD